MNTEYQISEPKNGKLDFGGQTEARYVPRVPRYRIYSAKNGKTELGGQTENEISDTKNGESEL